MNQEEIICRTCGTKNTSSDHYCQKCGSPLVTAVLVDDVTMVSKVSRSPKIVSFSRLPIITVLGRGLKGAKTRKRWVILLSLLIVITIVLAVVVPPIINPPSPIGPDGIGVTLVDGEYIGISDGRYAFDTNRDAGPFMLQASESLRNGNLARAQAQWDTAHEKDTNDAEPLIYEEDQKVLTSGIPYITVIIGISLNVKVDDAFSRDALQAAYIVQRECNANLQISGGKKLRLLIANSGSDSNHTKGIASQVVKAAQYDKTVIGVAGWTTSATTLNALPTLVQAHLPIVAGDIASNELTDRSPYFFRVETPSSVHANLATYYVESQLKSQRLIIFRDQDDPYSLEAAQSFAQKYAEDGYHIASTEVFKTGDAGALAQQVQSALKQNPDLIYIPTTTVSDITTLLATIPTTGYPNLKVLTGVEGYELVRAGGTFPGYTRMVFSSSAFPDEWSILGGGSPVPPFFKDYPAVYDPHNQHSNSPYTYSRANGEVMMDNDALSAFLVASKNATQQGKQNPTTDDIRNALSQINSSQTFQGITGAIAFASDGNPINRLHFILRVVDGGYIHVAAYQGCFVVVSPCDNDIHILE